LKKTKKISGDGAVMWSATLVLLQGRSQTNKIRSWS